MPSADPAGTLRYLLARANPFSDLVWVRHRASGLHYRVNVRDVVGRHILRYQGYEHGLTAWLLGRLAGAGPSALFVDVGANLGWYSLQAAHLDNVGRVLAIEPEPANHALLRVNVERNGLAGKVDTMAVAAGAAPGSAVLHAYKSSNLGKHSIAVDHGGGSHVVRVESLDGLLEHAGLGSSPIAAIKIDVEGYEPSVLAGASAALQRCQALLVELSPALSREGGLDLPAMIEVVRLAGLRPRIWDREGPVPDFAMLAAGTCQGTVGFGRD